MSHKRISHTCVVNKRRHDTCEPTMSLTYDCMGSHVSSTSNKRRHMWRRHMSICGLFLARFCMHYLSLFLSLSHTQTQTHTYTPTHTHARTHTHTNAHTLTHTHTQTRTQTNTYLHTHVYIHTRLNKTIQVERPRTHRKPG